jgi:streptogrisin C
MARRSAVLIVAVPALVLALVAAAPARASSPPGGVTAPAASLTEAQARAARFRAGMGFPSDPAVVRAMDDVLRTAKTASVAGMAVAAADISTDLGVPLTRAEQREVELRQKVIEDDTPGIKRLVHSRTGREPAGIFMDNLNGGVLTVAVTDSVDAVRKDLATQVSHPDRLKVVQVGRSMDDLKKLAASVHRDRETQPVPGVQISGLAIDEPTNRVTVDAVGDVAALQRYLDGRYGSGAVLVEAGSVTPTGVIGVDSAPFRGGQAIYRRTSTTVSRCTSGFVVWTGTASSKNYYMLTAGHCGPYDALWRQADSVTMGRSDKADVNGTDAQIINISNTSSQWNNEVALSAGNYRAITSSQGWSADIVGQTTCITGSNFTGLRCGALKNKSYDVSTGDLTYTAGREADVDCNPGDSGGPALYGNQARGTISVKITRTLANDTCVYTHIYDNLTAMGATMATSG